MHCFSSTDWYNGMDHWGPEGHSGIREFPISFSVDSKSSSGGEPAMEYKNRSHCELVIVQELRSKG